MNPIYKLINILIRRKIFKNKVRILVQKLNLPNIKKIINNIIKKMENNRKIQIQIKIQTYKLMILTKLSKNLFRILNSKINHSLIIKNIIYPQRIK